jgi:hypothetical protein
MHVLLLSRAAQAGMRRSPDVSIAMQKEDAEEDSWRCDKAHTQSQQGFFTLVLLQNVNQLCASFQARHSKAKSSVLKHDCDCCLASAKAALTLTGGVPPVSNWQCTASVYASE